jgi:PAS domain S-box-containing protein
MPEAPPTTILNVDDNEPTRYARSRILRQAGFEVVEAATGPEALHRAMASDVQLVLLDVNLPEMSGLEVCRRLKADPATASIPVLHLTAMAFGPGSRLQGLESGADGYLVEPVEPEELVASVRALLRLRQAEESTRAVARQWQATFDAIGDGVCLLDAEGRVTRCNAAAARLLGKASGDIVGRPFHEAVYGRSEPVEGSAFLRMRASGSRESKELRVGDQWFHIVADPVFDEAGRLDGAVYILSDATARKQGEARRSAQFAITRVLASSATVDDAVPALLQAFCESLEWDGGELWLVDAESGLLRLTGAWPAAAGPAGPFPAGRASIALVPGQGVTGRVWASGQPEWITDVQTDADVLRPPPAGAAIPRTSLVIPMRDAGALGVLLFFTRARRERDEALLQVAPAIGSQVGEFLARKRAEQVIARLNADLRERVEELQTLLADRADLLAAAEAARAEAEAANQAKDEFLATVSHELRTPLSAVLGWVHLLRTGSLDEATRARALETLHRNARVQAQLINDLLDMSRIITGRLRLDLALLDLEPVVRAALEAMRPAAEAKGIRLEGVMEPGVGSVRGDSDRLQQIAANLLSNAVKFTPGGGTVLVTLTRAGSHVELSVTDTGIGIAPEFLPHVFDRFRQADSSTTRAHGGLGIGLTIAKELAELHGGSIRAESPGLARGATFTLALPLPAAMASVVIPPEPTVRAQGREAPPAARRLAGIRVLIVDDDPDARDLLAATLETAGAETRAAASVPEALTALAGSRPDVIVADIGLPGADGYALVRQLRAWPAERGGTIPAVALTAYARDEDRTRSLAAGFQSHLAKPVAVDILFAEILRVVAARRA